MSQQPSVAPIVVRHAESDEIALCIATPDKPYSQMIQSFPVFLVI
jgi:hypothetical protein